MLLATGGLACDPALAHDAFGGGKPLFSGAAHLLTSPLSLAAMFGLLASAADAKDPWPIIAGAIAGTLAVVGVMLPQALAYWMGPVGAILVGLVAAAGLKPVPWRLAALAFAAGLAAGASAQLDVPTWPAALGAGAVVFIAIAAGLAAFDAVPNSARLQSAVAIGRRIAGAWVVAIGALLGALAVKMHTM